MRAAAILYFFVLVKQVKQGNTSTKRAPRCADARYLCTFVLVKQVKQGQCVPSAPMPAICTFCSSKASKARTVRTERADARYELLKRVQELGGPRRFCVSIFFLLVPFVLVKQVKQGQ